MNIAKKSILAILLSTIWISLSEFARNELLFKNYWTEHYQSLGITFPSTPLNGAIWGLWSLLLAGAILIISKKFSTIQTTFLAWFMGFVMMWVVIGNLNVLPTSLLFIAVPLSLLECFIATLITKKLAFSDQINK